MDFYPVKNHHFEYTTFSDKSTTVTSEYDYDVTTHKADLSGTPAVNYDRYGGRNHIVRYTGNLTEDFTLSALWGKNRADRTSSSSEDSKPAVYDTRTGHLDWLSGNPAISTENGYDTREAFRVDLEYSFRLAGTHRLRGGYDSEDNKSIANTIYSGGVYWRYYTMKSGAALSGGTVPAGVTEVVRERIYNNLGSFEVRNKAEFLEDNWSLLGERLLLRLGLRNESFQNLNAKQQTFIKKDSQLAPRLGVSYDLFGDKTTKVFTNYGRYHLPIASNTNIRLAGGEIYTQDYYVLKSINGDYTPVKGDHIGNQTVYSDGSIKDPSTIVDKNIKPMYQDEYVFGIQRQLNKSWTATVRLLSRDLKTSIDDVIVTQGLVNYAKRNNITTFVKPTSNPYVLTNPGSPLTFNYDINNDGKLEEITLSQDDLGFPKAVRKYYAGEFAIEKLWDGKWNAQFSYTWSHSYGNSEGLVKSDNGQTDAGLTSNFDAIGLTNGSYGDLPNDHRHQFKLFGGYGITKEIQVGLNLSLISGRPLNKLGVYPSAFDSVANGYGAEAFWTGGETGSVSSRGSAGRTGWILTQDLSVTYKPAWGKKHLTFLVDVFNVLNRKGVQDVVEQYEQATGSVNPQYLLTRSQQTPRYVRLGVKLDF